MDEQSIFEHAIHLIDDLLLGRARLLVVGPEAVLPTMVVREHAIGSGHPGLYRRQFRRALTLAVTEGWDIDRSGYFDAYVLTELLATYGEPPVLTKLQQCLQALTDNPAYFGHKPEWLAASADIGFLVTAAIQRIQNLYEVFTEGLYSSTLQSIIDAPTLPDAARAIALAEWIAMFRIRRLQPPSIAAFSDNLKELSFEAIRNHPILWARVGTLDITLEQLVKDLLSYDYGQSQLMEVFQMSDVEP
ncbi:MAG TPA: hypothetical protein VHE55_10145 [Fimbriimonadaceae bacterium]|nr:hypothetical protein [Fimbriimonadaceae bacterium]